MTSRQPANFQEFLQYELDNRKMSIRGFADFIGVSAGTISEYLNGRGGTPMPDFVIKLARATEVDALSLFALAYPEVADMLLVDPELLILARRFKNLPENIQEFILRGSGIAETFGSDNQNSKK